MARRTAGVATCGYATNTSHTVATRRATVPSSSTYGTPLAANTFAYQRHWRARNAASRRVPSCTKGKSGAHRKVCA